MDLAARTSGKPRATKEKPVRFTPAQVNRMRTRLAAYRLNEGLTWLKVAQDILDCEATELWAIDPDEYALTEHEPTEGTKKRNNEDRKTLKVDQGWPITQEVLRKFVEGERKEDGGPLVPTTPKDMRKLAAIRDFLIHKRYLYDKELEEKPAHLHAPHSLSAYFQNDEDHNDYCSLLEGLTGEFCDVKETEHEIVESALINDAFPDDKILNTVVSHTFYRNPNTRPFHQWGKVERNRHKRIKTRYWGWGVCKGRDMLLLFVNSQDDDDNYYIYILISPDIATNKDEFILLRYPFLGVRSLTALSQEHLSETDQARNIAEAVSSELYFFRRTQLGEKSQ